ncbi:MAG: hypothetical protein ACOYX5_02830 [Actinomycetota bacterium]
MAEERLTAASTSGAIHDIGYRHYDGPRLGTGYIQRSLYVDTLKGAFGLGRATRSKVMPILLLAVMTFPALVLAIVTSVTGADEIPGGYSGYVFDIQVVIAIFVGSQSPAVVSRDLRFGVVPLYFSRPLARSQYVQAKYAGMATALFILVALPLTVLLAGALLAELPLGEQLAPYLRPWSPRSSTRWCSPGSAWRSPRSPRGAGSAWPRSSPSCSCCPACARSWPGSAWSSTRRPSRSTPG